MYRVIVVDDEMLIRKRICLGFDWEALGYEIAADTGDSTQALQMILSGDYDLAIVDIAMPGMNGIELVKRVREAGCAIRIIFLTGHSDFTYAKEAIRYGVASYVLKPVNEKEMTGILKELKGELDQERAETKLRDSLVDRQAEMQLFLEFRFFTRLLEGNFTDMAPDVLEARAVSMGLLTGQPFFLMAIRPGEQLPEEETGLYRIYQEYLRVGADVFAGRPFSLFFHLLNSCVVFYVTVGPNEVPFLENVPAAGHQAEASASRGLSYADASPPDPGTGSYYDFLRKAQEQAETLLDALNGHFPENHTCGLSAVKTTFSDLPQAWQEAQSALSNVIIFRKNVILWDSLRSPGHSPYQVPASSVRRLMDLLVENDAAGCRAQVQEIFNGMSEMHCSYEDILINVNTLLIRAAERSAMWGLEIRWLIGSTSVAAAFANMNSPEEMKEWFQKLLERIIESHSYRDTRKRDIPLVTKSCGYLREHSRDNQLTQAAVAEALGVTPAYLSDLFKKSMGISMMNYLTMLRLENARALLSGRPELSIRSIAQEVGYSDEFYFSRSFKKYYGVSPSQVRREQEILSKT